MSNIAQNLQKILSAIYGKDVRQAIHDSIEDCYNDGRSGATDLTARQMLAQISPSVNALIASNRALDTLELTVNDPINSSFELYTDGVPLKLFITGNVVSLDGVLKTKGTFASSSEERLILSLPSTLGTQFGYDAPKYYPKRKTRFVANGSGSAKFMLTIDTSSNVYFSRYNNYKDTSVDYMETIPEGSFVPIHMMWVCEGVPIDNAVGVVTDKTLSIEDMPADAKAVGDALGSASGGGLSNEAKQALLDCFEHVAWTDANGQTYYDALEDALFPPANLLSITALYTQSGTVYDTDTLDSLKSDLVVTATYDDSSTATVTSYTLSGTLTTGTSTITVSYGGKTTTFDVTVTHATNQYSVTNTLTHVTNSNSASTVNETATYTATLTADTNYAISSVTVTMGGNDITSTAYSNGTINIASVSGNIVITATATPYVAPIYSWNFKNSLTDTVGGVVATLGGSATQTSSGITLTSANDYLNANIGLSSHARRIEIDIASYDRANGSSHGRIITHNRVTTSQYDCGVVWRNSGYLAIYEGAWTDSEIADVSELTNATISYSCYAYVGGTSSVSLNGTEVCSYTHGGFTNVNDAICIGSSQGQSAFNLVVTAMRVYELT